MNDSNGIPSHIKLAQEKAIWDEQQKTKIKAKNENTQYVIVTEVDIPFSKLVGFLVKLAIAAVPAGIIVFVFWSILAGLFVNIVK